MITDELQRFYDGIAVDPEAERRVIAAVTSRPARQRSKLAVIAPIAVTAAVIVIAILVVVLPGGGSHNQPLGPQPTAAVIPPTQPGTITGAVLRNGVPVPGAQLVIQAWPKSSVIAHLKKGAGVPEAKVGDAVTDAHGSYVMHVSPQALTGRYLQGSGPGDEWIDLDIQAFSRVGGTLWAHSLHLRNGTTEPLRFVVDLGKHTVTLNGYTSKAPTA